MSLFYSTLLLICASSLSLSTAQNFLTPPAPVGFPHQAVVAASTQESQLPPHLLNSFYKNPRVRAALAQHSWFGPGEEPVYDRQADKIPRKEIYTVLNHAGFVNTRQ